MWTQHNNNRRTGWMDSETVLTPETVNSPRFGYLFSRLVDDRIYAQILYVGGVQLANGQKRDLIFAATASNTVYAFDAADPAMTAPVWKTSLLRTGDTPGDTADVGQGKWTVGKGYTDMIGHIGVTGTPVIDVETNTLYVVSKSKGPSFDQRSQSWILSPRYHQRLHALDIRTGAELPGWPVEISASVRGSSDAGTGSIEFDPRTQNQRAALALWRPAAGPAALLIAWGSHADGPPYHGWLMAYEATTGKQVGVFNTTLNIQEGLEDGDHAGGGSIWQAGQGPSVDELGFIYAMTANGDFDTAKRNFGSSFLKLSLAPQQSMFRLQSFFTPANWGHLNIYDVDLGSAGVLLMPQSNLIVGGGKEGFMFALDRNKLVGLEQTEHTNGFWAIGQHIGARHIHGSPVTWQSSQGPLVYVWPENDWLRVFKIDHAGRYDRSPEVAHSEIDTGCGPLAIECMPGGMLSISSRGSDEASAIVWASVPDKGNTVDKLVDGRLIAFRAVPHLGEVQELWRSDMWPSYAAAKGRSDMMSAYRFSKFCAPTVAYGRVYLSTFSGEVRVYGLSDQPVPRPLPRRPAQPDRLMPGEGLNPNDSLVPPNRRFKLILGTDSKLVLYDGASPLWTSGVFSLWPGFAIMQPDGNFVEYDVGSKPIWATHTSDRFGSWLRLQDDGNLVLYDAKNAPLWATNTVVPTPPSQPDRLAPNELLIIGKSIVSPDRRFNLILQPDGNLVLYQGSKPLWATGTDGKPAAKALMQTDGNFVVYDIGGKALWATHTSGHPGCWLRVQDDGNLVLYAPGNTPLWASNTVIPAPPPPPTAAIEDGQVYKEQSKPEFYLIKGGKKLWIPSINVLANLGFTTAQVRIAQDGRLASIPSLPNVAGPVLDALNMPADYGKVKPSDVFFGPFKSPEPAPVFGGIDTQKDPNSVVVRNFYVAGWLVPDGDGRAPFAHCAWSGIESLRCTRLTSAYAAALLFESATDCPVGTRA